MKNEMVTLRATKHYGHKAAYDQNGKLWPAYKGQEPSFNDVGHAIITMIISTHTHSNIY